MGFVSEVLSRENGIHVYYIIGLLIFIGLFIVILLRTYKIPKADIVKFKTSILEDDDKKINY